jgi:hypothetical protein
LCRLKMSTQALPLLASRLAARTRCQLGTDAGLSPCTATHRKAPVRSQARP